MTMLAPAAAATPHIELACGSRAEFLEQLRRHYGLAPDALQLDTIHIELQPAGDYRLLVRGPNGQRRLSDSRCSTLRRTALVIAAASSVTPRPAEPPAPKPQSEAVPATGGPALAPDESGAHAVRQINGNVRSAAASPSARRPRAFSLGAGAGVEVGLAPSTAALFELDGAARWGAFGARFAARVWPSQTAERVTPEGYGLRWRAFGGRLSGFYAPVDWLRAELGLRLDHLQGQGLQLRTPGRDQVWLLSPELELAWTPLRWAGWAAALAVRGRLGLQRPRFAIEPDRQVIHRVPGWGAAALFRVSWGTQ